MTEALYGSYDLKRGDKDTAKKWGGQQRAEEESHVEGLQKNLETLGTFIWTVNGNFDEKTQRAVKMFQWNAKNLKKRLNDGIAVDDTPVYMGGVTGSLDQSTREEIARWLDKSFKATGDLIRIKESKFSSVELGAGFEKITHPDINDGEMVVSAALLEFLKSANSKAAELSLSIVLNQTLRVNGVAVSGAVVTPAIKSQHLIGHAFDCNIVDGDNWNNSTTFANSQETENAKNFITAMKDKGLRWGGEFTDTDTPHFDKQLNANTIDYEYKYFFNQRMISEQQKIPLKTW